MRKQRFGITFLVATTLVVLACIAIEHLAPEQLSNQFKDIVSLCVFTIEGTLLVWSIYQILVGFAGLAPLRDVTVLKHRCPRILCLTAAHNEESVIAQHIESLKKCDYPSECYDIVILADNCSDATASMAREAGATVWQRENPNLLGKGHALKWAIHSKTNLTQYEAICIFDADNVVELNFLQVMADNLARGYVAIQGYLDTKNPWDSWVTASYASAYWFMNRLWQRARIVLGLSGALGGTGFCLSTDILREVPWEATSLTEDLEYTVRLVLRGYKVHWTNETRVYDEKPIDYDATVLQRRRWMQGHWLTALRFTRRLIIQWFKGDLASRSQVFDILLYTWQPVFVVLMGFNLILTGVQWVFGTTWFHPWIVHFVPIYVWVVLSVVGFAMPLLAFLVERVGWRAFTYFPIYLLFNISWVPIALEGMWRVNNTEWVHTKHHRSLAIDDVSRLNSNR